MKIVLTYDQAVARGKTYLEDIQTARYKICELALQVCDIKVGGQHSVEGKKRYSIDKFAKDIGMPHRTLGKWLEIYRNVVKKLEIPIDQIDQVDNRVLRNMTKKVNSKSTKAEVQKAYDEYRSWGKADYALDRVVKNAVTIRNLLQDYDLKQLDQDSLNKLFNLIDQCYETKNQYLKTAKKKVKKRSKAC